jgi:hypothetical protein
MPSGRGMLVAEDVSRLHSANIDLVILSSAGRLSIEITDLLDVSE